ncbi:DUF3305 domain-containing protein [Bradyrhizobium sp. CCBAU 51627]|uniref:DUF3305 domain-containing protein n=1 Tax=Bradyrhizobium sp. CCBAU 51627 TaxID=1325088 RepID=UPI00230593DA|nr:DUF3305 domain-containing protein [Bradyrhizobium sp. CCBAU 51627]MDA9434428.1 molybdopterin-guanine dinucleotide biosynthesis protein A [Bradyrhizobium sp. CCBAU 51627]
MSPAAEPLLRIPLGVVVERRRSASPWTDLVWCGTAVLPDEPDVTPWTLIREQDGVALFYAGTATVDLYRSEAGRYSDNLASRTPSVWIVLSPSEGAWPYVVAAITADPAEAEAFAEAGANLVEAVPMPAIVRETIESFIAEHYVERVFVKRARRRADPEALAHRSSESGRRQ